MNVNDLVAVMTQVVDGHMRQHPELEASPDGVAALRELFLAAAQRLAGDPSVVEPQTLAADSTRVLMEAITDLAEDPKTGHSEPGTLGTARRLVSETVVSTAVARRCPLWPFCAAEAP